jgi:forkhead box protein J1
MIENGTFKKRRNSRDSPLLSVKRLKREEDELTLAVNSIKGTREDKLLSNGSLYGSPDDSDDDSLTLRGDFNWTAILNQDIDIGGVRVKTEQIIDSDDSSSPLIAMSPPSSETNSDDLGLDDLFSQTDISMDTPLDCTTHVPLDLTVTGTGIRPPDWWADTLLHDIKTEPVDTDHRSTDLHTPVAPSPRSNVDDVWTNATGLSHSAFDLDNLFDIDNIPSPPLL